MCVGIILLLIGWLEFGVFLMFLASFALKCLDTDSNRQVNYWLLSVSFSVLEVWSELKWKQDFWNGVQWKSFKYFWSTSKSKRTSLMGRNVSLAFTCWIHKWNQTGRGEMFYKSYIQWRKCSPSDCKVKTAKEFKLLVFILGILI